jgi:hypothetical protein
VIAPLHAKPFPSKSENLKLPIAIIVICSGLASASADQPTLDQISGDATLARRIDFIERYLQIQRLDWQLKLPKDYSATVTFRQRGADKPTLELSLEQGTTTPLFYASAPDGADKIQITFGGSDRSVNVYLPKPKESKTRFGHLDGVKDTILFEVSLSAEATSPQVWCEIHFHKK